MRVDGMGERKEAREEEEAAGRCEVKMSGLWFCSFRWGLRLF